MKDTPFTEQEEGVMKLLIKAHNAFCSLPPSSSEEIKEWILAIHRLQDLLGVRVLRRDYPKYFNTK
jgi:hypothetical protein